MKISKKKRQEIERVSFLFEILEKHTPSEKIANTHWINNPPEMWTPQQKDLFEMMRELESKTLEEVMRILE